MICKQYNLAMPKFDQCQYNMLERQKMESDYLRLFKLYNYGITTWYPLLAGILTGKYNDGIPDESRLKKLSEMPAVKKLMETYFGNSQAEFFKKLKQMAELAKEVGCSQAQLAMAFVISYKNTSTAIVGATKPEQLEEVVKAVEI